MPKAYFEALKAKRDKQPPTQTKSDQYRRENLKKRYRVSPADYIRMHREQKGKCAICKSDNGGKAFHVDHDHTDGHVRGLLCLRCNVVLGRVGDSLDILRAMYVYLSGQDMAEMTGPTAEQAAEWLVYGR